MTGLSETSTGSAEVIECGPSGKTIPQYKPVMQLNQEIKLLSPAEPRHVTLDDDHSLLADIVKAG